MSCLFCNATDVIDNSEVTDASLFLETAAGSALTKGVTCMLESCQTV